MYNKGPYQAWLTINSRVIVESLDGTTAYAAWFSSFTPPDSKVTQDSTLIPVGGSQQLVFSTPCNQPYTGGKGGSPCLSSANLGSTFRMYVYLNGYDQKGNIFIGTEYLGPVKIIS